MKVVRFHKTGAPEVLQYEDLPDPVAVEGQVLVQIETIGVNFAETIRRRGGFYPSPTSLPHIPGTEVVGRVKAVGAGVASSWIGHRVFARSDGGSYAEYIAVPEDHIYPFPDGVDPIQGIALFIQGLTAALVLKDAGGLKSGQSVFIEGAAGGVGTLAVQLAKLYGASTVIGGASSDSKRALVKEIGADHAIEYRQPGWSAKVKELTGGHGVSLVLDMSGGEVFEESFDCLGPKGRVVVYGMASGSLPPLKVERLFFKSQGLTAFFLGTYFADRPLLIATLNELGDMVRTGRLKVQVGGTFPLAQAAEAHRAIESGQSMGKLVLLA